MSLFPIFVKMDGRHCLVVGAGNVALEKISSLLLAGASIRVVAPAVCEAIEQLAAERHIQLERREFQEGDLEGQSLVITATNSKQVNRAVFLAAQQRNLLCNSVDDPPNCDYYFASIVQRGPLQIAISTAGESPALAQRLRREIDAQLPPDIAEWVEDLGSLRREILVSHPAGDETQGSAAPAGAASGLQVGTVSVAAACASRCVGTGECAMTAAKKSTVYLVGAGPGDPELLTLKAADLLATADVVLHDDLVPQGILDRAGSQTRVLSVGKRCGARRITQEQIHTLMIENARRGFSVVRLKSGDPLIFGRAGEEIDALERAGIPCEVVPGITAMFAAAAAVRKSLTDRRSASKVILTTAHHAPTENAGDVAGWERPSFWRGTLPNDATLGIYMPGRDLRELAWDMLAQGMPANLPCVVVSHISLPDQKTQSTMLGRLAELKPGPAPLLVLAGWPLGDASGNAISDLIQVDSLQEALAVTP